MTMATKRENGNTHAWAVEERWMFAVWIVVVRHIRKFRQFKHLWDFIKQQVSIEACAELDKK